MKNLAIIGASYLQLPLIEKAKMMGFTTHVFAWAANDVGEKMADYFYPISIIEKERILKKCKEISICGICSIASDLAILTVNYVAEKLDLTGNTLHSTDISTNKHLMRLAFEKHGVPSPKSVVVNANTDFESLELSLPAIVKPTDRSGSRGVRLIISQEELRGAVLAAINESFEKRALIEDFVEGKEYSVEYISFQGKHHFLALTEKYTTGAPNFIETGHMEPAVVNNVLLEQIQHIVEYALDSLEIENGASHSEIIIAADGTIKVIEVGGRMGGDCIGSDLVKYSTGIDFVKCVINVACGKEPDLTPVCKKRVVKSKFLFTKEDFRELEILKKEKPEKLIRIAFLNETAIGNITDSSNRAGCYVIEV